MSRQRLEEHREIWARKPVLARVYGVWFDALLGAVPRGSRVLEVGAGPGLLAGHVRARRPDLHWVASDLIHTPWNDLVGDGLRLPVRAGSLDVVATLDLVHHLARPAAFFEEAVRILRPGGRLAAVEPWVSPLSYPIYRFTHPEGCNLDLDPWDPFGASSSADKEPLQGDNACTWKLVRRTPASRWLELGLEAPRVTLFNGFAYLLSLGFRRPSLLPSRLAGALVGLDARLSLLSPVLGMRALVVWRRGG